MKPKIKLLSLSLSFLLIFISLCSCSDTVQSTTSGIINISGNFTENTQTAVDTSDGYADVGELKLRIFKMGKSDAYLFRTSEKTVLIDCGDVDDAEEILTYLAEKGISSLDCLIFTHLDKKSIGGAASLINNISVSKIIEPNYIKQSEYYSSYTEALNGKSIDVQKTDKTISFELSDVLFDVFPCNQSEYSDDNNYSSAIRVTHKDNTFLFIGDAKSERIEEIISSFDQHDFLMIPDNGAIDDKTDELLDKILPTYAAITCSEKNPADPAVLELLSDRGINYYLTTNGSIKITSDGSKIIVEQ